jgi:hypothetical protein
MSAVVSLGFDRLKRSKGTSLQSPAPDACVTPVGQRSAAASHIGTTGARIEREVIARGVFTSSERLVS